MKIRLCLWKVKCLYIYTYTLICIQTYPCTDEMHTNVTNITSQQYVKRKVRRWKVTCLYDKGMIIRMHSMRYICIYSVIHIQTYMLWNTNIHVLFSQITAMSYLHAFHIKRFWCKCVTFCFFFHKLQIWNAYKDSKYNIAVICGKRTVPIQRDICLGHVYLKKTWSSKCLKCL